MKDAAELAYYGDVSGTRTRTGISWRERKRLAAVVLLGGFTLLVLMAAVFGEQGLLRVRQLERERRSLEGRIAVLEQETGRLRREVRGMQTDPFLYEKAARERLGLVRPGEVVYDFRPDPLRSEP